MNRRFASIALMALLITLTGCGGGANSSFAGSGSGSGGSSSSTGGGTSGSVSIGSGSGSSFQKGALAIGIGSSTLSAGGSTSVTATIVNADGSLYAQSVSVSFNSPCVSSGLATIVDATPGVTSPTSTVTTTTGTATATYTAKGCSSSDTITATASISGSTVTATGTITVQAAQLGSIQFVSATPPTIALKGMGGVGSSESSTVVFKVLDTTGGIKPNTDVTFALNTTVGGVSLSSSTAKSDASGLVQTVVTSGTVAEPISVIATVQGPNGPISTQSTGLAISGGVPSQKYFSLSVDTYNPEGFDNDGATATITARLGDRFGNPVPDGTTVSFNTRGPGAGGTVGNGAGGGGSCSTTNGACQVTWTSQNPRPATGTLSHVGDAYILVYASPGEEGFDDNNGDGVFDAGDTFTDEGEIYADSNASGSYDSGENFFDFNQNGSYDGPNGKWDGVNCKDSSRCGNSQIAVGGAICIVMAGSHAIMTPSSSSMTSAGADVFTISDENGNTLPKDTTITLVTVNLVNATATMQPSSYKVGNVGCGGTDPSIAVIVSQSDLTKPATGSFYLEATTPTTSTVSDSPIVSINIP
ncbi:MAG TPA: hypothetical protein VFL15_06245 [Gammaproteobacteria bacterium]|nr:hypothetical protein [Gammaproteobacteria bacterium]